MRGKTQQQQEEKKIVRNIVQLKRTPLHMRIITNKCTFERLDV